MAYGIAFVAGVFLLGCVNLEAREEPVRASAGDLNGAIEAIRGLARPRIAPAKDVEFRSLLQLVNDNGERLSELRRDSNDGRDPVGISLTEGVQEALLVLSSWAKEHGGLASPKDRGPESVFPLIDLSRVALRVSSDTGGVTYVDPVLYLAYRLRNEGDTAITALAGWVIADAAVDHVLQGKQPTTRLPRNAGPCQSELQRAFALLLLNSLDVPEFVLVAMRADLDPQDERLLNFERRFDRLREYLAAILLEMPTQETAPHAFENFLAKQHAAAVAHDDDEFVDLFLPSGLDSQHKRMREQGARFASATGEPERWPRSCDSTTFW